MRLNATLALLLCFSLNHTYGQDAAKPGTREDVVVGGRTLKLPAPAGFERVDGLDLGKDRLVNDLLPASNRYLARFDPPKESTAHEGRSFNAQVLRSIESMEIGDRTFADMKQQTKAELDKAQDTIRQELAKASGKAEKALQDAVGADAALSVSDVAVLGYFDESPSSLGFTMALNVAAKSGDQNVKGKVVAASMIVPVNGRLIYLYANTDLKSEADRKWAEQSVTAWRDMVLAANPRVEGPAARSSIFKGVGRAAIVGAIIGGVGALVAVFAVLLRKKAK
ncbi:hypothetical protein [Prosthecobacter sp.]|uniref:hypothetical protein n=1 Tax=Prosthecobacter sp. TaxID=1965333 RepID=UPI0037830163